MAAQMSYIDTSNEAARRKWWEEKTYAGTVAVITEQLKSWRGSELDPRHLLRRDMTSAWLYALPSSHKWALPARPILESQPLGLTIDQLKIYDVYEDKMLSICKSLSRLGKDEPSKQMKHKLKTMMMAVMNQMRASLIHPIVPAGRELTVLFSPTRRCLKGIWNQAIPKACVYSQRYPNAPETAALCGAKGPAMAGTDTMVHTSMDADLDGELDGADGDEVTTSHAIA